MIVRESKKLKLEPKNKDQEAECSLSDIQDLFDCAKSEYTKENAKKFLSQYSDGDEIIEYCTSINSWKNGMGSHGYMLKRDGAIVESFVLKMN